MSKSPWKKVDTKTYRLEANGHTAEVRRKGAKWQVWINGKHQERLDSSTVRWAKTPATMMLFALPRKKAAP